MIRVALAALSFAALLACGNPAAAPPHAARDAQAVTLSAEGAEARVLRTADRVVVDYQLDGQWVARFEYSRATDAAVLTTARFSRPVPKDAVGLGAAELAGLLGLDAADAASLDGLDEVNAALQRHAAELQAQLGVSPVAKAGVSAQALDCTTNCCLLWQRASEAYLRGNTAGGAYWEGVANQAC